MVDFSALHLALGAVRAARTGLDVTSNNVANSSTPGYTRQRVTLASSFSRQVPGGLVGTGVVSSPGGGSPTSLNSRSFKTNRPRVTIEASSPPIVSTLP